jgi:hypothetical protein
MKTKNRAAFEGAMERLKSAERMESALILMRKGDEADQLCAIALAWENAPPAWAENGETCPTDDAESWNWCWRQVNIDKETIKRISGVQYGLERLLAVLIGNRLIYPDGTLSTFATKALRHRLKTALDL